MSRLQLFIASSRKKNKGGKVNKTRQVANKAAATTYVYTWSRCLLTPISSWRSIFFLFLPSSHPLFVNCKQRKTSTRREISQVVVTCFLWLALFSRDPRQMEEALHARIKNVRTWLQLGIWGDRRTERKYGCNRKMRLWAVGAVVSERTASLRLFYSTRVHAQPCCKDELR